MEKYKLLPEITEDITENLINEIESFANLMKVSEKEAKKKVQEEIEWLKENKEFLGNIVEAAVDSALDLYSDILTHKEWESLRILLIKGILTVLQGINLGLLKKKKLYE